MKNGPYELVRAPDDYPGKRYRGRYVYEHILVWWSNTGYLPVPGEVVHHKNGKKRDNRFRNLELKTIAAHNAEHARPAPVKRLRCASCKKRFSRLARDLRLKKKRGQTRFYCSPSCALTAVGRNAGAKRAWTQLKCPVCRKPFELRNSELRRRIKQNKTHKVACSKSCGTRLRNL
jgi:hypothetical protein